MDLMIFFENVGRIADALDRIADTLETRSTGSDYSNTVGVSATDNGAAAAEKPKRTRRTKAEMQADAAAEAVDTQTMTLPGVPAAPMATDVQAPAFQPAGIPIPAASAPASIPVSVQPVLPEVPSAVAPVAVAPVVVPPVVQPVPLAQPAPVPQPVAPTVTTPPVAAPVAPQQTFMGGNYMNLSVEQQFTELSNTVVPHFNTPYVRDTLVAAIGSYGLGMPFSDPADRALPGAQYRALANEARYQIYAQVATAISQVLGSVQPASI